MLLRRSRDAGESDPAALQREGLRRLESVKSVMPGAEKVLAEHARRAQSPAVMYP